MAADALLAIIDHSGRQLKWLSKTCKRIATLTDIVRISSIYSDEFESEKVDENVERSLVVALSVKWMGTSEELFAQIRRVEDEVCAEVLRDVIDILILTFRSELRMTPVFTLPHPRLHEHAQLLYPAAEIMGEYIHPVLKQSLQTLAGNLGLKWGRYFDQGLRLLDFS